MLAETHHRTMRVLAAEAAAIQQRSSPLLLDRALRLLSGQEQEEVLKPQVGRAG